MLIICATHPIQYQVPLWRKMTEAGIELEVWYFTDFGIKASYDVQFGKSFSWDLPMLEGYKHRFLKANEGAAPNKGFRGIIIKENLKKLLKKHQATHVYINGWQVFGYWQAVWAAKSLSLEVIFKGESNDLKPENQWKWPFKKLLLKQFFNRIDYFLYIGAANKRLYKKHHIAENKLLPGLYCVDNERFQNESLKLENKRNEIRAKWGIPDKSFCILFSGKFIPKKRPLDLILAVKALIPAQSGIHLLYVGDGLLYEELKQSCNVIYDKENGMISELNSAEVNVSITGFLNQTEIPQAYAAADVLVLPSDYGETWGLVVNEAMASGIPAIVANQCGSAEDLIKPIYPALVFETGNIAELSKAISWWIKHTIDKQIIINQVKNYSYQSTIKSVQKILNNAKN